MSQHNSEPSGSESLLAALRWLRAEIRFRWRWRKHPEVIAIVNPHPAPPGAVERLRERVISDDWETP